MNTKFKKSLGLGIKLLFLSLFMTGFGQRLLAQSNLCASSATTFCCEYVSTVSINGVVRNTSNTGFSSGPGYQDFSTSSLTNLTAGSSYPVSVTVQAASTYLEYVKVWFDFNGNGDLQDAGELVMDQNATFVGTHVYNGNITVPTTAYNGPIYIRVIMVYSNVPQLCGSYTYGNTLDFKATISGGLVSRKLNVATAGSTGGSVVSSPAGINTAQGINSANFADGSTVTLTASNGSSATFTNWSGGASGTAASVAVPMNADKAITANFATLPAVTTSALSSITYTGAASGGTVSSDGGQPVTARGVCWNSTGSPTTAGSKTSDGSGTGSFSSSLSGLSANTTYYVRSYATNAIGTSYGNQVSFTTAAYAAAGAINFSGANEYVKVANSGINFSSTSFTIEAWAKRNAQGTYAMIFSQGGFEQVNKTIHFGFRDNGSFTFAFYGNDLDATAVSDLNWHHWAATYNATTKVRRLYRDGVIVAQDASAGAYLGSGNTDFIIGQVAYFNGMGSTFNGNVDELRIWTRELCQNEIQNNLNGQLPAGQTGLAAYYQFNQGLVDASNSSVTSLTDASGNNRTGTLFNFALTGQSSNWITGKVTGTAPAYVAPTATITAGSATSFCQGGNVVLTATTGATYQWYKDGSAINGATAQAYTANASGNYNAVVVNSGGCVATSNSIAVTVNAYPQVTATAASTTLCNGSSTTLSASGASTYSWSNGQTGSSISVNAAGNYSVTGTANGCSATSNIVSVTTGTQPSVGGIDVYQQAFTDAGSCSTAVTYPLSIGGSPAPAVSYSFSGATTGSGSGNGSGKVYNKGTTHVTVTATNSCGSASNSFDIKVVDNVKPVALCKPLSITLDASGHASITASQIDNGSSDNCGAVTTSISREGTICGIATENNTITLQAPAGTLIDRIDFASYGTPTGNCGSFSYGWCHSSISQSKVEGLALGRNSASIPATNGVFGDPCGGTVKNLRIQAHYSAAGNAGSFDCSNIGNNEVILTVTDADGNVSSCTSTVTVVDNTAPVPNVASLPVVNGQCSVTAVAPTATDNCAGTVTATTADPLTYSAQGTYTLHWNYSDGHGNNTTQTQQVLVKDISAPVPQVTTLPTITAECTAALTAPKANDNCAGLVTATTVNPTSYSAQGTYTVNWTYNDGNGNSSTQQQTVVIKDVTAPVPNVATLATVNAECSASVPAPTATDNCSGIVTASTLDPTSYSAQGTYSIHWVYTDAAGNTAQQTQTVIIKDNTPPVIACAFNVSVNVTAGTCGAVVQYNAPSATDNCGSGTLPTSLPGYTYKGTFGGHTYFISNSATTPEDAHARAIALGGHLVTISSAQENAFVSAMNPAFIWIGHTDRAVEGTFRWVTSEPVTYSNWNAGEPNNAGDEDWAVINWGPNGTWNDWTYSSSALFVVEFEGGNIPTHLVSGLGSGATFPVGTTTENWEAVDAGGNRATCSFTVTVVDNIAPVPTVANLPVLNGQCSVTAVAPTATDNCAGTVTATTADPLTYSAQGTYTIHWNYSDGHGNSKQQTQQVLVKDVTAPVPNVATLATVNAECSATVPAPTATDNCSAVLTATTVDPTSYSAQGSYTIHWVYTDAVGNKTLQDQTVLIKDVTAPMITAPAAITVQADPGACSSSNVALGSASASDNCGYTIANNAPAVYPKGVTTVTWTATDVAGNSTTATQLVTVIDREAPVPNAGTIAPGTATSGSVTINIPSGQSQNWNMYTYNFQDPLPSGAVITGATMAWSGHDQGWGGTGAWARMIVSGTHIGSGQYFGNNRSFSISYTGPIAGYTYGGVNYIRQDFDTYPGWVAYFTGGTLTLNYEVVPAGKLSDVTAQCSATLVAPTAADNCAGLIVATTTAPTTYAQQGNYSVRWKYTDADGNSSYQDQNVLIHDTEAPALVGVPADITVECDAVPAAAIVTATDNCTTGAVVYSEVRTDGSCPSSYKLTRTWKVTDIGGNTTTATQIVTVQDTKAPELTVSDVSVNNDATKCGAVVTFAALASDNCSTPTISYSQNPGTYFPVGSTTVTATAKDACGNTTSKTFTVTVSDNELPVVHTNSFTIQLDATGAASITAAQVDNGSLDNCGIASISADKTDFDCSNTGANTVTLTVTDVHGNVNTATAIVTVEDHVAPVISCPASVTLNCQDDNTTANTGVATATDACGIASITHADVTTQSADANNAAHYNYAITRTWTAVDNHGNASQCVQIVTVQDITAPVIACPAPVTLNCQDNTSVAANGSATATDNCAPVAIASTDVSTQSTDVNDPAHYNYSITRTWTATDVSGNSSNCVQVLTVQDITAPVVTTATASLDATVECSDPAAIAAALALAPSASDICAPVTIHLASDVTSKACGASYTRVRQWNFTDVSGNSSALFTQTLSVVDRTAPVVTTNPGYVEHCFDTTSTHYTVAAITGTDNCTAVTYAYTVTGADGQLLRSGNSADASGTFTVGLNTITWTLSDACGNSTLATATVRLNAPIKAAFNSFTLSGGRPNTIYTSTYAPAASSTVKVTATGGTAPYSYEWIQVGNAASFTASSSDPTVITTKAISSGVVTYKVIVTDSKGCKALFEKTIQVVDARCGNKEDKVLVCHGTGSASNPWVQICVSPNAVPAQLGNGSYLGACSSNAVTRQQPKAEPAIDASLSAFPNPARGIVQLRVTGLQGKLRVEVLDSRGSLLLQRDQNVTYKSEDLTLDLQKAASGLYTVRVSNGTTVLTTRVVIAR